MMLPKIESVAQSEDYGRYQVEPLEPGFGVTLGNALRRVLLSSLPGAAITSIRIDNVYHEFTAIDNVREDVTEIVMGVKKIRLRLFTDRPVTIMLEATGPGVVTAADMICPPDVEIVNVDQPIATLDSKEAALGMELTVEKGRGYVAAEEREGAPIGVIPVDAIYTPVHKVNYTVENVRVGQTTDFDRLVLELWTDGTITPDDAVSQAAQILVKHLQLVADFALHVEEGGELQVPSGTAIPPTVYDTPIEDFNLSVRAYNCLKRASITKAGQVLEMTVDDLLAVRNFGRKSLYELQDKLSGHGMLEGTRLGDSFAAEAASNLMPSLEEGLTITGSFGEYADDDEI
jgi:DNA-directed RNA polymerase subunit alpha